MTLVLAMVPDGPLRASQPAAECERAAIAIAAETGVPADILGALTLTETGRRAQGIVRPWAWSVNAEGTGTWFDDPSRALAFAEGRLAQGRRNLDIGCFQLNYRWHGANFASVADMFDPVQNARYAARFLRQLYTETGDWRAAAGAFHSRRPGDASKYLVRFDELRAGLRRRGWAGLTGTSETYNSFAAETAAQAGAAPGGVVQVLRRIAGAGPPRAQGPALVPEDGGPQQGGIDLDGGQAPAGEVGGTMPAGALGLGVEVPVPGVAQGGAQDIALDMGGGPAPAAAMPPGQMPVAISADAAPAGQWPPQPLPGEELSLQQLAMDLRGQSAQPTPARQRESQRGRTLLGVVNGDGQQGAAGSLAVLAEAGAPLLRDGAPMLARGRP